MDPRRPLSLTPQQLEIRAAQNAIYLRSVFARKYEPPKILRSTTDLIGLGIYYQGCSSRR